MMSFEASYSVLLLFFTFALVQSNAVDSPAELYWRSKLGSITMPEILKASLQQGSNDKIVKLDLDYDSPLQDDAPGSYVWITYTHNEEYTPHDGEVLWFTSEKLTMPGTKMSLYFLRIENETKFLPLHVLKSTANATNKLQAISDVLSLDPKSKAVKRIKQMLKDCSEEGIKDEIRYCVSSLEAMVDYVTNSKKGKYKVISTDQGKGAQMEYVIQKAQKINKDDQNNLVCHKLFNPYAVFLCHNIKSTDIYSVSLVGADGKLMNAVAVCHKDTSNWYPKHKSFQVLKLKPGGKPICHFLNSATLVWL